MNEEGVPACLENLKGISEFWDFEFRRRNLNLPGEWTVDDLVRLALRRAEKKWDKQPASDAASVNDP